MLSGIFHLEQGGAVRVVRGGGTRLNEILSGKPAKVAVIGAGATGMGVAVDLLLRGVAVVVLEMNEVGSGTSGRFHGLLHSGGRYVVTDPQAAVQCAIENQILKRMAPGAIEDCGGYFVSTGSDPEYEEAWVKGCEQAGIDVTEISRTSALTEIPELTPGATRIYRVPDAVLKGFVMLKYLLSKIRELGGDVLEHHEVDSIEVKNGKVCQVSGQSANGRFEIPVDAVVNAAGASSARVAELFGVSLNVIPSSGVMVVLANRHLNTVINHLGPPGDGDIFVPHDKVLILGTTDVAQADARPPEPSRQEANYLMSQGTKLIPNLFSWRVLRAFTGVRPLFGQLGSQPDNRSISRDFKVIDHGEADGLEGAFSIVGGKWTTFRLMAETAGDCICRWLGITTASQTKELAFGPSSSRKSGVGPVLCECEGVTADELESSRNPSSVEAVRLASWFAMGPCQGTYCSHRVIGRTFPDEYDIKIHELRQERSRGIQPVAWGENAQMAALMESVRCQGLGETC